MRLELFCNIIFKFDVASKLKKIALAVLDI